MVFSGLIGPDRLKPPGGQIDLTLPAAQVRKFQPGNFLRKRAPVRQAPAYLFIGLPDHHGDQSPSSPALQ